MKKGILFLVFILVGYVLFTRFTYVDNPLKAGPPPDFPCAGPGEEARPQENFYPCKTLESINQSYLQEVKPILEAKCLMCHGMTPKLPRYATLPPSSWLVEGNRKEAKEEINLLWDIPIRGEKGEESQAHALEEIQEVVEENSMPPMVYKLMHWQSGLTADEKSKILDWVKNSQKKLVP